MPDGPRHFALFRTIGFEVNGDTQYEEIEVCEACVPKHSHFPSREAVPEWPCEFARSVIVERREFDGPASAAREAGVLAGWHMLMYGNVYFRGDRLWCPECDAFCPCSCCEDVALLHSNSGSA